MKKYFELTSREAIEDFILCDNTLAPEQTTDINKKLQDLIDLESKLSVTITIPTHRTSPDNKKDPIILKNLISEAELAVAPMLDKKEFYSFQENLKEAQNSINHSYNLNSLILYANENFSSVVKLPIDLEQQCIIGKYFDLSPLYKMQQQNENYYILCVSKQKIRLIEAYNDKLIKEIDTEDFPFENTSYYTTNPKKLAQDIFTDNLIKEFFNDADKRFQKYEHPFFFPIILLGDVKTVAYYKEMMDHKNFVVAQAEGSFDNCKAFEVVEFAYKHLENYKKEQTEECKDRINKAESANLLSIDINDIYKEISIGNAETLFIGNNTSLRGEILNDHIFTNNIPKETLSTNEMIPTLINMINQIGGCIRFIDDEILKEYNGIALIRRYNYMAN